MRMRPFQTEFPPIKVGNRGATNETTAVFIFLEDLGRCHDGEEMNEGGHATSATAMVFLRISIGAFSEHCAQIKWPHICAEIKLSQCVGIFFQRTKKNLWCFKIMCKFLPDFVFQSLDCDKKHTMQSKDCIIHFFGNAAGAVVVGATVWCNKDGWEWFPPTNQISLFHQGCSPTCLSFSSGSSSIGA
jgi:hypothetical protein